MNAASLRDTLAANDIRLGISPDGERITLDGPLSVLTPVLRAEIVEHKPELLRLLAAEAHATHAGQAAITSCDRFARSWLHLLDSIPPAFACRQSWQRAAERYAAMGQPHVQLHPPAWRRAAEHWGRPLFVVLWHIAEGGPSGLAYVEWSVTWLAGEESEVGGRYLIRDDNKKPRAAQLPGDKERPPLAVDGVSKEGAS